MILTAEHLEGRCGESINRAIAARETFTLFGLADSGKTTLAVCGITPQRLSIHPDREGGLDAVVQDWRRAQHTAAPVPRRSSQEFDGGAARL